MNSVYKYQIQLIILLVTTVLFAYISKSYPSNEEIELFEVFIEGGMACACLFLMFWIERLNTDNFKTIFYLLLISTSLLFMGHLMDALDEITIEIGILDFLEDTFRPIGFILFIFANLSWVRHHENQAKIMRELAKTDPLTGLLNRRAFTEQGNSILHHSCYPDKQVSIIIIDIDYFKQVNDNFGHQFGDEVLIKITSAIKSILRKNDCLARIGGEEFAVLLHDTSEEETKLIAEKIRSCVEHLSISINQQEVKCTISLGLAINYAKDGRLDDLIGQADTALYQAKTNGRNCWEIAQAIP